MDNYLVMENITKVYDNGVMANNGVNFSAKKGEIHAICGENGAGKLCVRRCGSRDAGSLSYRGPEGTGGGCPHKGPVSAGRGGLRAGSRSGCMHPQRSLSGLCRCGKPDAEVGE